MDIWRKHLLCYKTITLYPWCFCLQTLKKDILLFTGCNSAIQLDVKCIFYSHLESRPTSPILRYVQHEFGSKCLPLSCILIQMAPASLQAECPVWIYMCGSASLQHCFYYWWTSGTEVNQFVDIHCLFIIGCDHRLTIVSPSYCLPGTNAPWLNDPPLNNTPAKRIRPPKSPFTISQVIWSGHTQQHKQGVLFIEEVLAHYGVFNCSANKPIETQSCLDGSVNYWPGHPQKETPSSQTVVSYRKSSVPWHKDHFTLCKYEHAPNPAYFNFIIADISSLKCNKTELPWQSWRTKD